VRRLLLVGAGHAHLHVLRTLARAPLDGVRVTLVNPFRRYHYSGMVPGYLQGTYAEAELAIDLPPLCAAAGAELWLGRAERVETAARRVRVDGEALDFDLLSLDVGSEPAGLDVPGACEHARHLRPMGDALAIRSAVDDRARAVRAGGAPVRVTVVGGGAGAVEVALALHRRIVAEGGRAAVTIVEREEGVVADYAPEARARLTSVLTARGITLVLGRTVTAVQPRGVLLDAGGRRTSDVTVWATGAAPPGLLARSDLPTRDGYLLVDATLRAADGAPVWGAGDCVTLLDHPEVPKAGVFAVRQAPVLAHNLLAALRGGAPRAYRPQRHFLSLINTADGRAFYRWHGLSGRSRLAWLLKDAIDRRWVRRHQ